MESEVRKEETSSRDCLVQFLFVFLKKKNLSFSHGHTCMTFQFSDAIVLHDNVDNF